MIGIKLFKICLNIILGSALGWLALTGCGPKLNEEVLPEAPPSDDGVFISLNSPQKYQFQDPACQENKDQFSLEITSAQVWRIENSGPSNVSLALSETYSSPGLESKAIKASYFARKFVRTCKAKNGDSFSDSLTNCEAHTGENKPLYTFSGEQKPVKICQNKQLFFRDTVESAALNAIETIQQVAEIYEIAFGIPFEKVTLDLFPEFISRWESGKIDQIPSQAWLTDNLAYFPNNKIIAILPDSSNRSHRYYEWEFVVAHETGHHIGNILIGEKMVSTALQWLPELHIYGTAQNGLSPENSGKSFNATIVRSKVLSAIAEGYADDIASILTEEKRETLAQLPCIGSTRDVYSPLFADKVSPKILTADIVSSYFSGQRSPDICGAPNYSSPHHIGAIIAHAVLMTFDEIGNIHGLPGSLGPKHYKAFLMSSVSSWLLAFSENEERLAQAGFPNSIAGFAAMHGAFEDAYEEVLRGISRHHFQHRASKTKAIICKNVRKYLPALDPPPFQHYCR